MAGDGELGDRTAGLRASIVVPTRNRTAILSRCIASLADQSVDPDQYEILIIDNASVDETEAVSARLVHSHRRNLIRYLHESVPGLLASRHRGASEAGSEILCFVDDDVVAHPEWLQSILQAFEDRAVHLVGGPSVPRFEVPPPGWIEEFYVSVPQGRYLDCLSLIDLGSSAKEIAPYFVWGLNFSIRKNTMNSLGGFHPDGVPAEFLRYRGDGEGGLSHKMLHEGLKCQYHPGAKVEHLIDKDRLRVEYFQDRRYREGISDSYSAIRRARGTEVLTFKEAPPPISRRLLEGARAFSARLIRHDTGAAYAAGYNFHLSEVRSDPDLLAWVLKPNYLTDYDFRKDGNSAVI